MYIYTYIYTYICVYVYIYTLVYIYMCLHLQGLGLVRAKANVAPPCCPSPLPKGGGTQPRGLILLSLYNEAPISFQKQ